MIPEKILLKVCHSEYWKTPHTKWGIDTWDEYFFKKFPNEPNSRKSHRDLNGELEILTRNLSPKSKEGRKVLTLRKQLKVSVFTM
jgi:hypothetical protein